MTVSKRTSSATLVNEACIRNLKMRTTDGIMELGDKRKPAGLCHSPSRSFDSFCPYAFTFWSSLHKKIWLYIFLKSWDLCQEQVLRDPVSLDKTTSELLLMRPEQLTNYWLLRATSAITWKKSSLCLVTVPKAKQRTTLLWGRLRHTQSWSPIM